MSAQPAKPALLRDAERRFDPGFRAVLISCTVLVLLLAVALPWVGPATGWHVLFGPPGQQKVAGLAPRIFLIIALAFGVFASMLGLGIRRYGGAWICSLGADAGVLVGGLAIWSQQTSSSHQPGPGPGPGLILALFAMLALAIFWAGIVWKRTPPSTTRHTDAHI